MINTFKSYKLNIFMVIAFFLSQVVNVNASYLKNNIQEKNISDYVIEKNIPFHISDFNYKTKNEAITEGKVEKVAEFVTIGNFGMGMLIGYATTIVGMLLGWIITKIVALTKSS
ncbi:hypothetical protein ABID23_000444 [Bartonella silvatica]|uniref:Protein-disulfide reductase n=1 Tax=Bartonella silvatica TaxID=357760 RepID=A0ABV2HG27_9HYPH